MAREILFKAKRMSDSKWVEGSYIMPNKITEFAKTKPYIMSCDTELRSEIHWIDKETLCQYTGLTDKNGNKIWENDVVKDTDGNIYKCYWCSCNCEYMLDDGVESFGLGYRSEKDLEVIGNIFDNPELLGGADNG